MDRRAPILRSSVNVFVRRCAQPLLINKKPWRPSGALNPIPAPASLEYTLHSTTIATVHKTIEVVLGVYSSSLEETVRFPLGYFPVCVDPLGGGEKSEAGEARADTLLGSEAPVQATHNRVKRRRRGRRNTRCQLVPHDRWSERRRPLAAAQIDHFALDRPVLLLSSSVRWITCSFHPYPQSNSAQYSESSILYVCGSLGCLFAFRYSVVCCVIHRFLSIERRILIFPSSTARPLTGLTCLNEMSTNTAARAPYSHLASLHSYPNGAQSYHTITKICRPPIAFTSQVILRAIAK